MARCIVNSCPHAGNTNAMAMLTATSNFANCLKNMGFMRHLQEEMGRKASITRCRAQAVRRGLLRTPAAFKVADRA